MRIKKEKKEGAEMDSKLAEKKVNKGIFLPPVIALIGIVVAGIIWPKSLAGFMSNLLYFMSDNFGWYLNLLALLLLILSLVFIIGKYGDIRIGGKDAKPAYTTFQWISMTICGGIGTGLLFWAMGEPIYHYATPPAGAGVEAFSRGSAIFAVSQAMWDWSFVQYAIYTVPAIIWAILVYNKKMPLSYDSLIRYLFKRDIPWLSKLFRILTVFCICGCVSNSMGAGLLQIGGGLNAVFGLPQNSVVWLIVAVIIGATFILSCLSGIGNGLKKLSAICVYCFIGLLIYTLITGNTSFIGKISCESIGSMLDHIGLHTTVMNSMSTDTWCADWIVQYFASFIVYMPVFGMFFCRMSKGRTVRQFVLLNVLVPSTFCIIWIGIFGGQAMYLQTSGKMDIWTLVNTLGMQTTVFQIINSLPLGKIICLVFLVTIVFSFSTLADPMSSVLASVCVDGQEVDAEPPKKAKLAIGLVICAVAYIGISTGGITSIKGLFTFVGVIMSVPGLFALVATFRACKQCSAEKNSGLIEKDGDTAELKPIED